MPLVQVNLTGIRTVARSNPHRLIASICLLDAQSEEQNHYTSRSTRCLASGSTSTELKTPRSIWLTTCATPARRGTRGRHPQVCKALLEFRQIRDTSPGRHGAYRGGRSYPVAFATSRKISISDTSRPQPRFATTPPGPDAARILASTTSWTYRESRVFVPSPHIVIDSPRCIWFANIVTTPASQFLLRRG